MSKVPVLRLGRRAGRGEPRRPGRPERVRDRAQDRAESGHHIHGEKASDLEWAVYTALRSLGWTDKEISFQVRVFGGRALIGGGQVLDFVVDTGGGHVVIDVRGVAWHGPQAGKAARDRWREIQVMATPNAPRYVVVWEDVARDWSRLRALLLREIGAR